MEIKQAREGIEETRVEERNRKCKKEDGGKGTPCPALNREKKHEGQWQ